MEGEQIPLLNGDGVALVDRHGQVVYQSPDRDLLCDQDGYAVYNENGDLCLEEPEELNEDLQAILMWLVAPPTPISAEQVHYMVGQNQQLQFELDQALLAHQNDAERAQCTTKQRDAQFQSDIRAMQTEFAKRQAEWLETSHIEWGKYEASACEEQWKSDEQCKAADAKWEEVMQRLQDGYAKRQEEMDEEQACRDVETEKQRALQKE